MLKYELVNDAISKSRDTLRVHCDIDGLEALLEQVHLLRIGATDHVHLMSLDWGGVHLDDTPSALGNDVIKHVKIELVASA